MLSEDFQGKEECNCHVQKKRQLQRDIVEYHWQRLYREMANLKLREQIKHFREHVKPLRLFSRPNFIARNAVRASSEHAEDVLVEETLNQLSILSPKTYSTFQKMLPLLDVKHRELTRRGFYRKTNTFYTASLCTLVSYPDTSVTTVLLSHMFISTSEILILPNTSFGYKSLLRDKGLKFQISLSSFQLRKYRLF